MTEQPFCLLYYMNPQSLSFNTFSNSEEKQLKIFLLLTEEGAYCKGIMQKVEGHLPI